MVLPACLKSYRWRCSVEVGIDLYKMLRTAQMDRLFRVSIPHASQSFPQLRYRILFSLVVFALFAQQHLCVTCQEAFAAEYAPTDFPPHFTEQHAQLWDPDEESAHFYDHLWSSLAISSSLSAAELRSRSTTLHPRLSSKLSSKIVCQFLTRATRGYTYCHGAGSVTTLSTRRCRRVWERRWRGSRL
jgi:hypothetical protein